MGTDPHTPITTGCIDPKDALRILLAQQAAFSEAQDELDQQKAYLHRCKLTYLQSTGWERVPLQPALPLLTSSEEAIYRSPTLGYFALEDAVQRQAMLDTRKEG